METLYIYNSIFSRVTFNNKIWAVYFESGTGPFWENEDNDKYI